MNQAKQIGSMAKSLIEKIANCYGDTTNEDAYALADMMIENGADGGTRDDVAYWVLETPIYEGEWLSDLVDQWLDFVESENF